jgi:hypothetical protein
MNGRVLSKTAFEAKFPSLPPLPSTAFYSGARRRGLSDSKSAFLRRTILNAPSSWMNSRSLAIRMKLAAFQASLISSPTQPRGMHWRTYDLLWARAQASEARSFSSLIGSLRRDWLQWGP